MNNLIQWWVGVVEDVDDPKKCGRVKVRNIVEQSLASTKDYIDTEDLPWAHVMLPVTAGPGVYGVGASPTWLGLKSKVLCFYRDPENRRLPVVMGVLLDYDPEDSTAHGVSAQARGTWKDSTIKFAGEPKSSYAAEYPYNKTITTARGHVIEIDDTPEAERINVYHRSGAYIEMRPDGSVVTRSVGQTVNFTEGSQIIYAVSGNVTISTLGGSTNILANGNITVKSSSGVIDIQSPVIGLNA